MADPRHATDTPPIFMRAGLMALFTAFSTRFFMKSMLTGPWESRQAAPKAATLSTTHNVNRNAQARCSA
jgi:hypothetical protein